MDYQLQNLIFFTKVGISSLILFKKIKFEVSNFRIK